jgi:hypothetical protein
LTIGRGDRLRAIGNTAEKQNRKEQKRSMHHYAQP